MTEKTFKTYEQMLDLLESRGIVFNDKSARSKAKKILQHEGYYNLINGYKPLFLSNSNPEQYLQSIVGGSIPPGDTKAKPLEFQQFQGFLFD